MITYHKNDLEEYLKNDWILDMINNCASENEKTIRTNKWLFEMDNKRMIYADVYGDILRGEVGSDTSVLDVGGGINALTKKLAENCDYHLLDFLAHGGSEYLASFSEQYKIDWINDDWYQTNLDRYDVIIANDIFPDVDMRMELFIEKMLPVCRELRLVLTYYNQPMFYQAKRVNDSEVLTFLSWDGEITALKLEKYLDRAFDTTTQEIESIKSETESIYRNGRQVSCLRLRGDYA